MTNWSTLRRFGDFKALNPSWFLHQFASCDIHLATGCGVSDVSEVPWPDLAIVRVTQERPLQIHD